MKHAGHGDPMKGFIYIVSAFETVNRSASGQKRSWINNDTHFWTSSPTWGICSALLPRGQAAFLRGVVSFLRISTQVVNNLEWSIDS